LNKPYPASYKNLQYGIIKADLYISHILSLKFGVFQILNDLYPYSNVSDYSNVSWTTT